MEFVGARKNQLQEEVVPSRTLYVLNFATVNVVRPRQTRCRQYRRKSECCQCLSARLTSDLSADHLGVEDVET